MRAALPAILVPGLLMGLTGCTPTLPDSGAVSDLGGGVGFGDYTNYVVAAETGKQTASTTTNSTGFSTANAAAAIAAAAGGPVALPPSGSTDGGSPVGAPLSALAPQALAPAPAPTQPVTTAPVTSAPLATTPDAGGATTATGAATASGAATAAATDAALFDPNRPRGDAPANIQPDSGEMTPSSQGLSDEQSFSAVTQRESIASDKARIAANRAQYVVIQPTEIPQRPDHTGPDIVKYALATTNPVGAQLYPRPSFYLVNLKTACRKYSSPDFAQQAFLAAGGPQKDPKGLDPDGDGFACSWDPAPYRNALK